MTIEFWPRRLLRPRAVQPAKAKKQRRRWPKLPIPLGKAHQKLSQAIICGDHELAAWLYRAALQDTIVGKPPDLQQFRERLDTVMEP